MSHERDPRSGASAFLFIGLGAVAACVMGWSAPQLAAHEAGDPSAGALSDSAEAGEGGCQSGGTIVRPNPTPTPSGAPLKDGFVNSLGMKFMHVPNTRVLFCIHITRVKDFRAFSRENPNINNYWAAPEKDNKKIDTGDDHPVVSVNWDEANAFCDWLSKKENRKYRLPTDREWSYAIGIGPKEVVNSTTAPETLDQKIPDLYPWGNKWPPPKGAGNYADTSTRDWASTVKIIPGYTDGFATTAPVMSFKPNKLGLYDMSGNIWQWCESWYDAKKTERVLRGGSWNSSGSNVLLSSYRYHQLPGTGNAEVGFRVVVEASPSTPSPAK